MGWDDAGSRWDGAAVEHEWTLRDINGRTVYSRQSTTNISPYELLPQVAGCDRRPGALDACLQLSPWLPGHRGAGADGRGDLLRRGSSR